MSRSKFNQRLSRRDIKRVKKKSSLKRVFISKQLSESDYFYRLANRFNVEVITESQIKILPIVFETKETVDWVFFSSSNAVNTFFQAKNISSDSKYAALGKSTAKTLNKFTTPNFIGVGEINHVATQFSKVISRTDKICFPSSDRSQKSIQKVIPSDQVVNIQTYKTVLNPTLVKNCDAYVFTSPSNVEAFFKTNTLDNDAKIIAIGKTTANELSKLKHKVNISWEYNNLALWDTI